MDLKDLKKKDISAVCNNVDNATYLLLKKKGTLMLVLSFTDDHSPESLLHNIFG